MASLYASHPSFRDRVRTLKQGRDQLYKLVCNIATDAPSLASTPVSVPSSVPKGAPIPVKVPTFDGNPLHWEKIESEFSTAIRTRAQHYSNFDIRCLLTDSLLPKNTKNIIRHHPGKDAPLVDLLTALRDEYGTPQIVGPVLIEKLFSSLTFDFDYTSLTGLTKHYLQTYDDLVTLISDSLS